jgi:hypothetical protein
LLLRDSQLDPKVLEIGNLAFKPVETDVQPSFAEPVLLDRFGQFRLEVSGDDDRVGDLFLFKRPVFPLCDMVASDIFVMRRENWLASPAE